jgi:TetR/AcrR family transcriptional regulator, repressor for uid operon
MPVAEAQSGRGRSVARSRQVLDAASTCFAEDGFHGTSMARLAQAAGMSVGHIYHYFDSKEAIIAAIVQRELVRQLEFFDELKQADDVLQALIDRAEDRLARRMDARGRGLRLEILAEAGRNPKIAAALHSADAAVRRTFREVLAAAVGRRAGVAPADLDGRMEVVIGLFDGMMIRGIRHPGLDQAAALRALKLAIRHLLTAPPDARALTAPPKRRHPRSPA